MRPEILVVEDDDLHAELIGRMFAEHEPHARLTRVSTLREARERLSSRLPDLVIADLRLPDGSGSDLLSEERDQARFPLVIMTSFGDEQVAVEAMRNGALDYIVKSDTTLAEMPHIATRALREWNHLRQRHEAEEALRRSEEHFRSLIENALDLIALIAPGGACLYASPAMKRLLGWEPEEVVGRACFDLLHPDDVATAERAIAEARAAPGTPQFALLRLRSREGEWRSFETILRLLTEGRAEEAVVLNARDVTERLRHDEARRALEVQLRQAQKLDTLGTLAGGIAHDFNNILQAIAGCSELALKRLPSDSPARRYLERSLEVSRRARDLVRQIVQFARRGDQRRETLCLATVAREVCRLLRAALPATVEIREHLEDETKVLGDASQIHQVVMNLATNALQAMGERGGTLDVAVERLGDEAALAPAALPAGRYVCLSMRDTGPGLPPEIMDRIFEPFFTTRAVGGGTGLGLSVAHGIVQSHGGAIVCESIPGQGATFRVLLPVAGNVSEGAGDRAATPTARSRVLLVDDDDDVVYVGQSVLEGLGHRVAATRDALEALEWFRSEPGAFDLAVLDELMPRMSGSQLAAELRRLRPKLPVVIASGHGLPSGALFDDDDTVVYLSKPFEARQLADAVATALGQREVASEP